ncbi:MAG: hypothetical protein H7841_13150 [Magnetospirillum sp. WYHS-4]
MFGFSITKILFTLAAILAVWYGYKWINRLGEVRAAERKPIRPGNPFVRAAAAPPPAEDVEDMKACPACGTYVMARGARACGRGDCPYPR